MQRPVVATAHGGSLETVIDSETGFLIPPNDAEALAQAIERAVKWDTYDGPNARSHIARKFSKKSLQDKTLAVYNQLML